MEFCVCKAARRDDETETVTILLLKDRYSRVIQAWVVERKGLDLDAADVAQRALMGLRSFGHRGRAYNERAILSFKEEEMMRRREVAAIPVESTPPPHHLLPPALHESENNGSVENEEKISRGCSEYICYLWNVN